MSYFKPKRFEEFRGKTIYEYLGVTFFIKYLLLTDLIMFRLRKKNHISSKNGIANELRRLEWQTRRDEVIHLIFMLAIVALAIKQNESISSVQWVLIFFINLYANIYPIFVQRHNRIRLTKLLCRFSSASSEPIT